MKVLALCLALVFSTNAFAQEVRQDSGIQDVAEASPPAGLLKDPGLDPAGNADPDPPPPAYIPAVIVSTPKFELGHATEDSFKFLMIQTGARLSMQSKTRHDLSGKFVKEYFQTLATKPSGWDDGDPWWINFVGHPIQGATSYHIARTNGASREQAFWWSVAYSTHFELSPLGEAGIGNVRISPTDLVLTPTAGFLVGMGEEWLWNKLSKSDNRFAKIAKFFLAARGLSWVSTRR